MKATSVCVHYDSFYFSSTEELHLGFTHRNSARTILQFCVKFNIQRQMHLYFNKTWVPPLFALSPNNFKYVVSALTIFPTQANIYTPILYKKNFQENHN